MEKQTKIYSQIVANIKSNRKQIELEKRHVAVDTKLISKRINSIRKNNSGIIK